MTAEVRETPDDAVEQVAALPRRVAHAVHALQALHEDGVMGPWRPCEIIVRDVESLSIASTCGALKRAMALGLVGKWGRGLYSTSPLAGDLKEAIEDRFLADTESEHPTGPLGGGER
jgi:hypothetical protein